MSTKVGTWLLRARRLLLLLLLRPRVANCLLGFVVLPVSVRPSQKPLGIRAEIARRWEGGEGEWRERERLLYFKIFNQQVMTEKS